MQHGSVFGHVYVLAGEHRFYAFAKAGPLGHRNEQADGLGRQPVLRVVEHQVGRLGGHLLAAERVLGEQVTQMDVAQLREVDSEGVPLRCGADAELE